MVGVITEMAQPFTTFTVIDEEEEPHVDRVAVSFRGYVLIFARFEVKIVIDGVKGLKVKTELSKGVLSELERE